MKYDKKYLIALLKNEILVSREISFFDQMTLPIDNIYGALNCLVFDHSSWSFFLVRSLQFR